VTWQLAVLVLVGWCAWAIYRSIADGVKTQPNVNQDAQRKQLEREFQASVLKLVPGGSLVKLKQDVEEKGVVDAIADTVLGPEETPVKSDALSHPLLILAERAERAAERQETAKGVARLAFKVLKEVI